MRRLLRNQMYLVDWIIIGYCSLMVLLLLCLGRPLSQYIDEILFYTGMAIIAALIIRFVPEAGSWVMRFLRILYPALMFTFFYRMTGGTMFLVFDKFFDYHLTAVEQGILGFEPSLWLDRNLLNTVLNELFMACYFAYYFMLPGLLIQLFVARKYTLVRQALASISLTFFVSYVIFFLYPIEGPRWHFRDQYLHTIDGPIFRQLVNFMIERGAVRGGCVPSTHVAVALVILIFVYRQSRKWGLAMAPVVIGLAIGTVWGRYHYLSDALVGAAIAVAATALVLKFHSRFEPAEVPHSAHSHERVGHVS